MAKDKYPFYPITYILKDQYNSIERVSNIIIPTMIFLASSDETINITDSLHEHGHVWSAIQENYIDAIDDNSDKITQALSDADFYDVNMSI